MTDYLYKKAYSKTIGPRSEGVVQGTWRSRKGILMAALENVGGLTWVIPLHDLVVLGNNNAECKHDGVMLFIPDLETEHENPTGTFYCSHNCGHSRRGTLQKAYRKISHDYREIG